MFPIETRGTIIPEDIVQFGARMAGGGNLALRFRPEGPAARPVPRANRATNNRSTMFPSTMTKPPKRPSHDPSVAGSFSFGMAA